MGFSYSSHSVKSKFPTENGHMAPFYSVFRRRLLDNRIVNAINVKVRFGAPAVVNGAESTMYRFSIPCTLQQESTTGRC